jgi:hypothetical protein
MPLRKGPDIPLEAVYSPERPRKNTLVLRIRCAVHRLRIMKVRFHLNLESAQHLVRHVPILQTTPVFALSGVAGVHDKQGLHC